MLKKLKSSWIIFTYTKFCNEVFDQLIYFLSLAIGTLKLLL